MIYEIKMPSLGADMDKAKLLSWHIHVNDKIEKGQVIANIETQKAAVEIESFKKGTVTKIIANEGDVIPVGQTLAILETNGAQDQLSSKLKTAPKIEQSEQSEQKTKSEQVPVSSANRTPTKTVMPDESIINIREAIAKAMSKSKKEIPHYYLNSSIEIDGILNWLDQINANKTLEGRILISAVFVKSLALALKTNPEMNGFYIKKQFIPSPSININIAISLKNKGVIVPALLDVANKNLDQINQELKSLVERARAQKVKQKELTDGTITLTALGNLGAEEVFGIIFPPQVALLGIGAIHKKACVLNDAIKIRNVINVSLAADHRVSDGIAGSKLLNAFNKALTDVSKEVLV